MFGHILASTWNFWTVQLSKYISGYLRDWLRYIAYLIIWSGGRDTSFRMFLFHTFEILHYKTLFGHILANIWTFWTVQLSKYISGYLRDWLRYMVYLIIRSGDGNTSFWIFCCILLRSDILKLCLAITWLLLGLFGRYNYQNISPATQEIDYGIWFIS